MEDSKYNIPILFVMFNRKDISIKSFEKIRDAQPAKLYLAGDGAREFKKGEKEKVEETRKAVLELIDWECEVNTLFQEENLGCSLGVYSAINWFFEKEELGIVLEDDCVVQESFFPFMQDLLLKYENDTRVGMIAGFNILGSSFSEHSYCFSKYKGCWGWATWKRSWVNMDLSMEWRKDPDNDSIIKNMGFQGADLSEWKYKLKKIDTNSVSAWDWQWYFSLASQNQLCIFPSVSLVSNIGFGLDATHTSNIHTVEMDAKLDLSFPLIHPKYIVPNTKFDKIFYQRENSAIKKIRTLLPISFNHTIKSKITKLFGK